MLGYFKIVKSSIHSCHWSYIETKIGIFNIVFTAVGRLNILNIMKKKKINDMLRLRFTLLQQRNMKHSIK